MELSDVEKAIVMKESKKTMDNFLNELSDRGNDSSSLGLVERDEFEREELIIDKSINLLRGDDTFRKIIFRNARKKNDNFIIAETKSWRNK